MLKRRGILIKTAALPGVALLCLVLLSGCRSRTQPQIADEDGRVGDLQWVSRTELAGELDPNESQGTDAQTIMQSGFRKSHDVILGPGDDIEVKFYYTPELDVRQVIRPDGNLSLLLVGEVRAEGKTPGVLTDELIRWYKPYLKEPHVAVIVRSLYNRRVYVSGQVMTPGVIEMPARMTLMEAIMSAGGVSLDTADIKRVVVIRQKGGIRCACEIDMTASLDGKSIHEPFHLFPKDVVFVPRTGIAKLNQWVDQHVNKIIPRAVYFRFDPID